jgi:hypothetical protein
MTRAHGCAGARRAKPLGMLLQARGMRLVSDEYSFAIMHVLRKLARHRLAYDFATVVEMTEEGEGAKLMLSGAAGTSEHSM